MAYANGFNDFRPWCLPYMGSGSLLIENKQCCWSTFHLQSAARSDKIHFCSAILINSEPDTKQNSFCIRPHFIWSFLLALCNSSDLHQFWPWLLPFVYIAFVVLVFNPGYKLKVGILIVIHYHVDGKVIHNTLSQVNRRVILNTLNSITFDPLQCQQGLKLWWKPIFVMWHHDGCDSSEGSSTFKFYILWQHLAIMGGGELLGCCKNEKSYGNLHTEGFLWKSG